MNSANQPKPPSLRSPHGLPVAIPVASSTNQVDLNKLAHPGRSGAGNTPRETRAWRQAERIGRQGLVGVRNGLSERDMAVLRSVAQHRFLRTRQIEQLHFIDHATPLSAARTCRRVLRRLASLRVLRHLERRVGGVRAGSASFVWALGPVGDRLLRMGIGEGIRQRVREPSERFLAHALAVADARLALVHAERDHRFDLVTMQTEPDCWRRYLGSGGEPAVLQPDMYAVTGSGEFEDCWFIEVDLGNEHLPTIMRKCVQYESYRATGIEHREGDVFPLVVWIMSTPERVAKLTAALDASQRVDRALFRVVTLDDLATLLAGGTT